MNRDLGAVVPKDESVPVMSILWFAGLMIGGLLSACSTLTLLLAMLSFVP